MVERDSDASLPDMHLRTMTPELVRDHGLVLLVSTGLVLHAFGLGVVVSLRRIKAGVEYPYVLATREQVEEEQRELGITTKSPKMLFNCAQRAHQNTLETLPLVLVLMYGGSIQHPLYAAIAGSVWLAGRVVFALGYSTGHPEKRLRGGFGYFGLVTLLGLTVKSIFSMIGSN